MAQGKFQRNQGPHAVSKDQRRLVRMLACRAVKQLAQIGGGQPHIRNEDAQPAALAMPAVVNAIAGQPSRRQRFSDVTIAAAVFAVSVDNKNNAADLAIIRQPFMVKNADILGVLKSMFVFDHDGDRMSSSWRRRAMAKSVI